MSAAFHPAAAMFLAAALFGSSDGNRATTGAAGQRQAKAAEAGAASAAPQQMTRGPHRMQITLERLQGSEWRAIEPGLVLNSGDRIRFRFQTNFDGHLYVMNAGTSGSYTLLFPREETGRANQIRRGQDYTVPATQAYFRVAGPPGHDIVYWMVSPTPFASGYVPLPPPPQPKAAPANLIPRCDDAMFRARGECIDSTAGPRQVAEPEKLPANLSGVPGASARGFVILRQQAQSVVSSPEPLAGPLIYEFRLAHR